MNCETGGVSRSVKCHVCEMTYRVGNYKCDRCMFRLSKEDPCEKCGGTGELDEQHPKHECPEPYPYDVAVSLSRMGSATNPIIVSPTQMARIKRGLKQKP